MDRTEELKTFLKATLPLVENVDIDDVINSSLVLAYYYGRLADKEDVSDVQFRSACSLVVSAFNGDSIQYLEECIKEFKEEVF